MSPAAPSAGITVATTPMASALMSTARPGGRENQCTR